MKKTAAVALLLLSSFRSEVHGQEIKKEPISGAGPSTSIVSLFLETFNVTARKLGYQFAVPPESTKHAGGLSHSETFLFGRTGRPLNEKERTSGKEEIALARMPIAFAVGSGVGITSLRIEQLEAIFTGKTTNWKEVGGPDAAIVLLGRESSEALFTELKRVYPFFEKAAFQTVYNNDTQIMNILQNRLGEYAIGIGAEEDFKKKGLAVLSIAGFSAGVSLGLVFDRKNSDHPVVRAAQDYARSAAWRQLVTSRTSALPPQ